MYSFRDLTESDVDYCYDIAEQLWGTEMALSIHIEIVESLNIYSQWPPIYVVAEHSGEVVGFTGFRRALFMKDAWEVCWTNIRKDHQRKGLGLLLGKERVERIRQLGGKYVICSGQNPAFALANGNKVIDRFGDTYILSKEI